MIEESCGKPKGAFSQVRIREEKPDITNTHKEPKTNYFAFREVAIPPEAAKCSECQLLRMFSKVRPGGIIGGDDYLCDPWHHGLGYEPTLVCPFARHFAEAMGVPFFALPFDQYLIIKEQSGHSFTNFSTVEPRLEVGKPSLAKALLRRPQPFSF